MNSSRTKNAAQSIKNDSFVQSQWYFGENCEVLDYLNNFISSLYFKNGDFFVIKLKNSSKFDANRSYKNFNFFNKLLYLK